MRRTTIAIVATIATIATVLVVAAGRFAYRETLRREGSLANREHSAAAARLSPMPIFPRPQVEPRPFSAAAQGVDESPLDGSPAGDLPSAPPHGREPAELSTHLDETIAAEPTDLAWARQQEYAIRAAFEREPLRTATVTAASCRSTLCRVELSHDDGRGQQALLQKVVHEPPFNEGAGFAMPTVDGEGNLKTVIYSARRGYELPPLEQ